MNVHMAPVGYRTEPAAPPSRRWLRLTRTAVAPFSDVEVSRWQPAIKTPAPAPDDFDWFASLLRRFGGAR